MTQSKVMLLEKKSGIARITLNRPSRLNALNPQLIAELASAIPEMGKDPQVRAVVITGAGRAFCSGGDFKGDAESLAAGRPAQGWHPEDSRNRIRGYTLGVCYALQSLPVPTIAMVNGVAVGLGFDVALACDMRVGSENARFMVGWTRRGVVPAGGTLWLLPRIIGLGRALEMIYTARFMEADEAERVGLLNKKVPASDLEAETMELARAIANGPTIALRLDKLNTYKGLNMDYATLLEYLAMAQAGIANKTEDFEEASRAFIEKREPVFRGR